MIGNGSKEMKSDLAAAEANAFIEQILDFS
jgi:hypothetical protein